MLRKRNLLICGGQNLSIHQHPLTLMNLRLYNRAEQALVQKLLWLIVMGDNRMKLSLHNTCQAYDLERFFCFGKQKNSC